MSHPAWYTRRMKNMRNIKLNKKEQEFIAENITKFDVVTGITVDEIEVRIHGEHFGGVGSSAIYRTNDIKAIYSHAHAKCVEADKAVRKFNPSWRGKKALTN